MFFGTKNALSKHLDMWSDDSSHLVRRTFHNDYYLKFDKLTYKNKVPFIMVYDFIFIIKYGNQILVPVHLLFKLISGISWKKIRISCCC